MQKVSQKAVLDDMMARPIPRKKIGIVHLEMVRESRCLYGMKRFRTSTEVAEMVRPLFDKAHRERVAVLTLSTKLEVQALEIAMVGGLNCCYVDMKELFKLAIVNNSSYIICIHNHPSGYAKPSREDELLTDRLWEAGRILGISLLDHIILGEYGYYSFRENGKIPSENPDRDKPAA